MLLRRAAMMASPSAAVMSTPPVSQMLLPLHDHLLR
jgi:hypothetical protein